MFAIQMASGGYVKRQFTSPTGTHHTKNAKSAFNCKTLAAAEKHLIKAKRFLRGEGLKIVVIDARKLK